MAFAYLQHYRFLWLMLFITVWSFSTLETSSAARLLIPATPADATAGAASSLPAVGQQQPYLSSSTLFNQNILPGDVVKPAPNGQYPTMFPGGYPSTFTPNFPAAGGAPLMNNVPPFGLPTLPFPNMPMNPTMPGGFQTPPLSGLGQSNPMLIPGTH